MMPLLQVVRPQAIADLVRAAEDFRISSGPEQAMPLPQNCQRCGYISSQNVCKACLLLEGLNKGLPSLGVSKQKAGKTKSVVQVDANAVSSGLLGKAEDPVRTASNVDRLNEHGSNALARQVQSHPSARQRRAIDF